MDLANMMSEAERADLANLAYEIHTHNGPQVTILTVPDLQDYPMEEFSIRVAEKWQLGSKEKDDGLLVIISKAERKVRIEVGNGIEGEITDYDTTKYTRGVFPEAFKRGDFHGGLRLFLEEVANKFNIKFSEGGQRFVRRAPRVVRHRGGEFIIMAVLGILAFGSLLFRGRPMARGLFTGFGFSAVSGILGLSLGGVVFLFILGILLGIVGIGNFLGAMAMGRGGRYGGGFGGGFGGGGWSGGGGGFSGGGSSGNW
jgi:uncharacterized protein